MAEEHDSNGALSCAEMARDVMHSEWTQVGANVAAIGTLVLDRSPEVAHVVHEYGPQIAGVGFYAACEPVETAGEYGHALGTSLHNLGVSLHDYFSPPAPAPAPVLEPAPASDLPALASAWSAPPEAHHDAFQTSLSNTLADWGHPGGHGLFDAPAVAPAHDHAISHADAFSGGHAGHSAGHADHSTSHDVATHDSGMHGGGMGI